MVAVNLQRAISPKPTTKEAPSPTKRSRRMSSFTEPAISVSPVSVCALDSISYQDVTDIKQRVGHPPLSSGYTSRKRRRVQFEEVSADPLPSAVWEPCDVSSAESISLKSELWYSKAELSRMKRKAKSGCKEVWAANDSSLDTVYPSLSLAEGSCVDEANLADLIQSAETLSASIHFQEFRGLEHLSSQKLCLARGNTMLNASTEILLEQGISRLSSSPTSHSQLEKSYQAATRPAAIYARIVALADAKVAQAC